MLSGVSCPTPCVRSVCFDHVLSAVSGVHFNVGLQRCFPLNLSTFKKQEPISLADWVAAGVVFLRTRLHKQQQTHRHTPCVHVGQPDVLRAPMVCDAHRCVCGSFCALHFYGVSLRQSLRTKSKACLGELNNSLFHSVRLTSA
ncbi:unnamed protein product [Boreogadus saida]